MPTFPFVPKSNAQLEPGQFWAIPLSDGRFGCGRVLRAARELTYGGRTTIVAAVLDWVGDAPPTADAIAGAGVLDVGYAHIRTITQGGGAVVGTRPLELDGIAVPASVNGHWGLGYAAALAEHRLVAGTPEPASEFREVRSPLRPRDLAPFTRPEGLVQFSSRLTDHDFDRLGSLLAAHPGIGLRAFGSYDDSITDLEFLRFFPTLRSFAVDAVWDSIRSLDGLRHLVAPDSLTIGAARRPLSITPLARLPSLRTLWLEGPVRDVATLGALTDLEDLTLRSLTLPDLSLLRPLRGLRSLDLKLGGTRQLGLLPEIGRLEHVELWAIKGLADVDVLASLPHLRYLFLESLPQVTRLPDFAASTALTRVHLQHMRGLRDLAPLATAPTLEQLLLVDMPHLRPEDLDPFVGHPSLRRATLGLGSLRRNDAARDRLGGLPDAGDKVHWRAV